MAQDKARIAVICSGASEFKRFVTDCVSCGDIDKFFRVSKFDDAVGGSFKEWVTVGNHRDIRNYLAIVEVVKYQVSKNR